MNRAKGVGEMHNFLRIDGADVAKKRRDLLKVEIDDFRSRFGRPPGLAVVIVGEDPASQVYVRNKVKTAAEINMVSQHHELSSSIEFDQLRVVIEQLNRDENVDGILVQLPLPKHLVAHEVIDLISPLKDPDGLTTENLGLLLGGRRRIAPCTPLGVMTLLDHYGIEVEGLNTVVVGRSNIVGKPMAQLLLEANATVTVCHSKTTNLIEHTNRADLVVVAAGQSRFLGREAFKKNAVVIDVGMHRPVEGDFAGRLCGDVRFEELIDWVSAATPVPKGVGPMTIQCLMENTLKLAKLRMGQMD